MAKRISYIDRIRLEKLLKAPLVSALGLKINQTERIARISESLRVNPSTIYREVYRNGFTYENYNAAKAHNITMDRIAQANKRRNNSNGQKGLVLKRFSEQLHI